MRERNKEEARDYILGNVISCVRRERKDGAVKFPACGDLEEYFRVNHVEKKLEEITDMDWGDLMGSFIVTEVLAAYFGIEPERLRDAARINLASQAKAENFSALAKELAPWLSDDDMGEAFEDSPIWIASTEDRWHGAGVMLLDSFKDQFLFDRGWSEAFVIPSSVHEVLLIRKDRDGGELNEIIRHVNRIECKEDEVLSDHYYTWRAGRPVQVV